MSQPLHVCTVIKAANGDEDAYKIVLERLRQSSFTYVPCSHDPKCSPPEEGKATPFFERLRKDDPDACLKLLSLAGQ